MAKNTRSNVFEGAIAVDPTAGAGVPATVGAILPRLNTTELWQKAGPGDTQWLLISSGDNFPPSRVAVVDVINGHDPIGAFNGPAFQTIAAALAAAPAQTPTFDNPCLIWLAPGTHTGDQTLVSNCHISALPGTLGNVNCIGIFNWTPGAGVNAPQTNTVEFIGVSGIRFTAPTTIDGTGKASSLSQYDIRNCQLTNGLTLTSRAGLIHDNVSVYNSIFNGALTYNNGGGQIVGSSMSDMTLTLSAFVNVTASNFIANVGITQTAGGSTLRLGQCNVFGPITVGAGDSLFAAGSMFTGLITSTTAAGAGPSSFIDIRGSEYQLIGNLSGPGPIDRSIYQFQLGPTSAGPQSVTFAVPYNTAIYNLLFTPQTAAATMPFVTAQSAAGFTFTDVGGVTYTVSVLQP